MISKQHITNDNKLQGSMKPEYITIHSTANERSTAQNERDNLNRVGNTTSTGFHYVVGDDIIIECVPPTTITYHAGDGRNGTGNTRSIGIEMVETGDRKKVINNTIRLVKHLQDKFNIPSNKVVRHYDWSKKNCPRILNNDGKWSDWWIFKTMIDDELPPVQYASKWAMHSWEIATKLGVIDGTRPRESMTREEVITVLDRLGLFKYVD